MADITIPGVNSALNTDKIVSKLMELERIPLERKKEELSVYESEKEVWQDLKRFVSKLEDSAKTLYGFENPFNERIAESDDSAVLTAIANRDAMEQEKQVSVLQKASADRFLSDTIDKDLDVPAGNYSFSIGEEEISFSFRGGNITRFSERINSRGKDLLRSQVVRNTPSSSVFLIESLKEGSANRLEFTSEDSVRFAVSAGILVRSDSSLREIPAVPDPASPGTSAGDSGLLLKPGASGRIPVSPAASDSGNMHLELTVKISNMEQQMWQPPSPPPGPDSPASAGIDFKGINISNAPTRIELPEWKAPEPPAVVNNLEVFTAETGGRSVGLPALRDIQSEQKIDIPLSSLGGNLSGIGFNNRNTYREITLSGIRVFDPEARGDYVPANAIGTASDSIVRIDGIDIVRESNSIDDIIPGVTLNIKSESDEPVTIKITPDREAIKDSIIGFVGHYNRLQADLSILTSNDGTVINELEYFNEEETEKAKERLGLFQGDSTLIQMKSRLQMIMMQPYSTSDPEMNLLSQIGISTNSGGFGSGINASKLRGYLEINEKVLDDALENKLPYVRQIFGTDSDGDLIVDSGAAFRTQEYARPFAETSGIFDFRVSSLDTRISRAERDISDYEMKLIDKEAELRNKYATMEGNINTMQKNSGSLNSLNYNNNR